MAGRVHWELFYCFHIPWSMPKGSEAMCDGKRDSFHLPYVCDRGPTSPIRVFIDVRGEPPAYMRMLSSDDGIVFKEIL